MRENAGHFLSIDPGPSPHVSSDLSDHDQLKLGAINFNVI